MAARGDVKLVSWFGEQRASLLQNKTYSRRCSYSRKKTKQPLGSWGFIADEGMLGRLHAVKAMHGEHAQKMAAGCTWERGLCQALEGSVLGQTHGLFIGLTCWPAWATVKDSKMTKMGLEWTLIRT